ncbi:MAG: lasso peptide biosynthesis B2 protein [Chloroflexota bacterium]
MRSIRRLLKLRSADWRLLAIAWIRLCIVGLALRWFTFRSVIGRIARVEAGEVQAEDTARARRYNRWIETAARYQPVRTLCLARSLALHWWLCDEGLPSELIIGVASGAHGFGAHAWVELGEDLLNGTTADIAPFTRLVTVGGEHSWSHYEFDDRSSRLQLDTVNGRGQ